MKTLALIAGLMMVGCGGGGGGGGGGGAVVIPPPVVLTGLSVSPAAASIDVDDTVALVATGTYSDGSILPVVATWSHSDNLIELDALQGSAVTATGLLPGTAILHAVVGLFAVQVAIDIADAIPSDPGPVYGVDDYNGRFLLYPAFGSADAPQEILTDWTIYGTGGSVMNPARTEIYVLIGNSIWSLTVATSAFSQVVALPVGSYLGLECDAQGLLFTQSYSDGDVFRCDAATGGVTPLGNNGGGFISLSVGADDALYFCGLLGGGISRMDANGIAPWAAAPAFVSGGMAINRSGELFFGDYWGPDVLRYVDVNADGAADDAGEESTFCTMPISGFGDLVISGLAASGGRSVTVNIQSQGGAGQAIYWARDLDDDGTGSLSLFHAEALNNLYMGGLHAAK